MIRMFQSNLCDPEPLSTNSFEIILTKNELALKKLFNDPKSEAFEYSLMCPQPYKLDYVTKVNDLFKFSCPEGCLLRDLKQISSEQYLSIYDQLLDYLYQLHRQNYLARCISTKTVYLTKQDKIKFLEFGFYPMLPRNINFSYDEYLDIYLVGLIMKELYSLLTKKTHQVEKLYQLINQISRPEYYKNKKYEDLQNVLPNPRNDIISYYQSHQFQENALVIQFNIQKREKNIKLLLLEQIKQESQVQANSKGKIEIKDLLPPSGILDTTQEISLEQKRKQFLIYKFRFIDETISQISQLKQSLQPALMICLILKVQIIICKQLLQDLQKNVNVLQIQHNQWQNFISSKEYQQLSDELQCIQKEANSRFQNNFEALKSMIQQSCPKESYQISDEVLIKLNIEMNFEGLKFTYREYIYEFLSSITFSNLNNLLKSKLTFRLNVCMIINKVFDFDHLNMTFRKIIEYQKLQSLSEDFELIDKFLNKATDQQLFDAAEDIQKLYFGSQQAKQK